MLADAYYLLYTKHGPIAAFEKQLDTGVKPLSVEQSVTSHITPCSELPFVPPSHIEGAISICISVTLATKENHWLFSQEEPGQSGACEKGQGFEGGDAIVCPEYSSS